MMKRILLLLLTAGFFYCSSSHATNKKLDPHYSSKGFFDIHVCNWPNQPLFLMGIFSTRYFDEIKSVEILSPDDVSTGFLDLKKFRKFKNKKKQLKKAFISKFSIPDNAVDGWYKSIITLKNNESIHLIDFVKHRTMPIPTDLIPANNSNLLNPPKSLHWKKIKQAKYYQIYIKDLWQDSKLVYKSKLLTENELILPPNILIKGGYYIWHVHARDSNEDIKLGDFNHGSLSVKARFSVQD